MKKFSFVLKIVGIALAIACIITLGAKMQKDNIATEGVKFSVETDSKNKDTIVTNKTNEPVDIVVIYDFAYGKDKQKGSKQIQLDKKAEFNFEQIIGINSEEILESSMTVLDAKTYYVSLLCDIMIYITIVIALIFLVLITVYKLVKRVKVKAKK